MLKRFKEETRMGLGQQNSSFVQEVLDFCRPYYLYVEPYLEDGRVRINASCSRLEAWQIILFSIGLTLLITSIWNFLFQPDQGLLERLKKSVFRWVKCLPFVRGKIKSEMDKQSLAMEKTFHKSAKGESYIETLPTKGLSEEQVLKELLTYKDLVSVKWSDGACSGTVYSGEEKLTKLISKVYADFAWTNPLHADVFPEVRKMEAEVVRMVCSLFQGGPETCGTMTSGGTESIMLACKAYRDRAYSMGIRYPEMVVPVTAHAAFDKGASYFGIKIVHIAIDEVTRKVDVGAMKSAINSRTCMLVGSAPQFPHGVIDPIVSIAKLGRRYNIPVHVDSCLGGFLIPFMRKAGFELEPFDFSLPGVTSISADTHKYGFAPKGSSVIMYSSKDYRKFQYFVAPDWPGGIYASPTFAGSRAGAIIAACWATLMYMGENGYVESTKKIINTTRFIESELRKVQGVFLCCKAEVSVIAVGSKQFNIYRLSDALGEKGWHLNALQNPACIHLCVTLVHTKPGVAQRFVADFEACTKQILKEPNAKIGGTAAMYGMAQSIPDRSLVSEIAGLFFDAYYNTTGQEEKKSKTTVKK